MLVHPLMIGVSYIMTKLNCQLGIRKSIYIHFIDKQWQTNGIINVWNLIICPLHFFTAHFITLHKIIITSSRWFSTVEDLFLSQTSLNNTCCSSAKGWVVESSVIDCSSAFGVASCTLSSPNNTGCSSRRYCYWNHQL